MTDSLRALVCSTPDEGALYGASFDPATGSLTTRGTRPFERPMYVAVGPRGERAYVANRADDGRVDAVALDADAPQENSGIGTVLDRRSSGGSGPCYVSVGHDGAFAFAANYDAGTVAMLSIDGDGRLGPPTDVVAREGSSAVSGPQDAPHPHAAVPGPDGEFLYVPDLGTDEVAAYRIDAAEERLRPAGDVAATLPPGTGPRHLAFGREGDRCYLVGELNSTVTTLARDPSSGTLSPVDSASTLPDGEGDAENAPSDVHVHPGGDWLSVSNRGHDSVATYRLRDGRPVFCGAFPTGGRWPRDVAVDPTGAFVLAENRDSASITSLAVGDDGSLAEASRASIPKPTCLAFVDGA